MNNKELIQELSKKISLPQKQIGSILDAYTSVLLDKLQEEQQVSFVDLGSFEVRKKEQRILINPGTKQRMLVPPKLVVAFKPLLSIKKKYRK